MDEFEFDADVRREVFAFLESATQSLGDVLPWDLLARGFTYHGQQVCLLGATGIWKPKILRRVPISICTAPPRKNTPPRYPDGMERGGCLKYCYRGTDPSHLDNAGLREAMQRGIPLVYFYGVNRGQYLVTWPVFIVSDDPPSLTFRVSVDDRLVSQESMVDSAATLLRDVRREYVTGLTVRRLHQQNFRMRVLRAYRDQCAFCQLRHRELLDAAHIIPDSDPGGEPLVSNGLALCKIHHAAFDCHILGIRPDLTIEVRQDILAEIDGPMLKYGLQEMNGRRMQLPSRHLDRPAAVFLAERYVVFRKAG